MCEALAAAVARDWGLRLGEPYPPGAAGYAVRGRDDEGGSEYVEEHMETFAWLG